MLPPTTLQAGKLRHRIEIAKPNLGQDEYGGWEVSDASVLYAMWASVEALTGRELYAAQQKVSEVTHKITIRYQPSNFDGNPIVANMLVWFQNREFQIQSVQNPDERTKLLILLCVERDSSTYEAVEEAIPG